MAPYRITYIIYDDYNTVVGYCTSNNPKLKSSDILYMWCYNHNKIYENYRVELKLNAVN